MKNNGKLRIYLSIILACILCTAFADPVYAQETTTSAQTSSEQIVTPGNLKASMTASGKILLEWDEAANADSYCIYSSTSSTGTFSKIGESVTNSYSDEFIIGKTYYFKVKAKMDTNGTATESDFSNSVKITCGLAKTELTSVEFAGSGKLKVSWKNVDMADGYSVYGSDSLNGTYKCYTSTSKTNYTRSSLNISQEYFFKVRAYKLVNGTKVFGDFSDVKSKVVNLKQASLNDISSNKNGTALITWEKVPDAEGYSVYVSGEKDGTYKCVTSTKNLKYTRNVNFDDTYYFKIRAYRMYSGAKVFGEFSPVKSFKEQIDIPQGFSGAYEDLNSVIFNWNKAYGADGYELTAVTDSGEKTIGKTNELSVKTATSDSPEKTLYKVRGYRDDTEGNVKEYGGYSKSICLSLTAPENVTAKRTASGEITVSWTGVDCADEYAVYSSSKSDGQYTLLTKTRNTSYTDTFEIGKMYYFKIKSLKSILNDEAESDFSKYSGIQCGLADVKNAEVRLLGADSHVVSWDAVELADGYSVYCSNTKDGEYKCKSSPKSCSYTVKNIVKDKDYFYKVRAFKMVNGTKIFGNFSELKSVLAAPQKTVITKAETNKDGSANVTWEAVENADGYKLYVSDTADGEYTLLTTTQDTTAKYEEAYKNNKIYFKAEAYVKLGEDEVSGESSDAYEYEFKISDILQKAVIANAETNKDGSALVEWEAVENADGYKLYVSNTADGEYTLLTTTADTAYKYDEAYKNNKSYFKTEAYVKLGEDEVSGEKSDAYEYEFKISDILQKAVIANAETNKDGSALVEWEAVENATGYKLYVSDTAEGEYALLTTTQDTAYKYDEAYDKQKCFFKAEAYIMLGNEEFTGELSDVYAYEYVICTPEIISAQNTASGKLVVSWTPVAGAAGYTIYMATSENGTFSAKKSDNVTSYTATSLNAGSYYYFKVRAYYYKSGSTVKSFTQFSDIVQSERVKATVSSLAVSNVEGQRLNVSWAADSAAEKYNVYIADSADGEFVKSGETQQTEFTISNLTPKQTYYIKVSPVYSNDEEGFLSTAKSKCVYIETPKNVQAQGTKSGRIQITWDEVQDADGYYVYMSEEKDGTYKSFSEPTSCSVNKDSLTAGKIYYFKVRSYFVDSNGNKVTGLYSDSSEAVPGLDKVNLNSISPSAMGEMTLSWKEITDAQCYEVASGNDYEGDFDVISTVESNEYVFTQAQQGTAYYFKVRALYTYGENTVYGKWSDVRRGYSGLTVPANFIAAANANGKIDMSWDAVDGAENYTIYMSEGTEDNYIPLVNVSENQFTKGNLTVGQTYYFKVRASYVTETTTVYTEFSNADSAKVCPAQPKITDIGYVREKGIRITWKLVDTASSYNVYKRAETDTDWSLICETDDLENNLWIDESVSQGDSFYYKVESICTNDFGTTVSLPDDIGTLGKAEIADYSIDTATIPYYTRYTNEQNYSEDTNSYWTIRSYLDRLDELNGGTLRIASGDYVFYDSVYVPSNVTVILEDGVRFIKTNPNSLIQFIGQSDRNNGTQFTEHNGVHDSSIICPNGTASLCQNDQQGTVMVIAHAKNILIDNITFDGSAGGAHNIELDASQNVEIKNCTFSGSGSDVDRGEAKEAINLDTPDLKTKGFTASYTSYDMTANDNILIHDNVFTNQLAAIGTHMYSEEHPHTNVTITNNTFTDCIYYAIGAMYWENPVITNNTFTNIGTDPEALSRRFVIKLTGSAHAVITNNVFNQAMYYIYTGIAYYNDYYSEELMAYQHYGCELTDEELLGFYDNTFNDVEYPYVYQYDDNGKVKTFHTATQAGQTYTVTPDSLPCRKKYTAKNTENYNSDTACYYMLRSYLEELDNIGGGTLILSEGIYEVTNILFVPSETTVILEEGAVIKSTVNTYAENIEPASELFIMQHSSESAEIGNKHNYSSSANCAIKGSGTIDMNGGSATAIVMPQDSGVEISGITFTGLQNGKYISLQSAEKVTISDCTFNAENGTNVRGVVFATMYGDEPCRDTEIKGCTFDNMVYAVTYAKNSTENPTSNVIISNNTFTNCGNGDIMLIGVDGISITDNTFDTLSNQENAAVHFVGVSDLTIKNNQFTNLPFAIRLKVDEEFTANNITDDEVQNFVFENLFTNILNEYIPYTLNINESQQFCYLTTLEAPVIINASSSRLHEAFIEWQPVSNAEGYQILRANELDGEYAIVTTVTDTSVTMNNLTVGKKYFYKVRGVYYTNGRQVRGELSQPAEITIHDLPAPKQITATSDHPTRVSLDWEDIPQADGYSVYKSFTEDGEYTRIAATQESSYLKDDCTHGMTYYLKIRAYYIENDVMYMSNNYSDVIVVSTPSFEKVQNISCDPVSMSSIKISWDELPFAEGYTLYLAKEEGAELKAHTSISSTEYVLKNCNADVNYYFKVRAYYYDKNGNKKFSGFSDVVSGKTGLPKVSGIKAEDSCSGSGKITVSWDLINDSAVAGYSVYMSETPDGSFTCLDSVETNTFTKDSLSSGVVYYFKVRAYTEGKANFSPFSDVAAAEVITPDMAEPATLTSGECGEILASWQAVSNADGYEINMCSETDDTYVVVGETTENQYLITGLAPNKYYVRVRAFRDVNNVRYYGNLSYARSKYPGTEPITGFEIKQAGSGKLKLICDAIDNAEGYTFYMSETADGTFKALTSSNAPEYTKTDLQSDKTYYFKVRAYFFNKSYFSDFSEVLEGKVQSPDQVEPAAVTRGSTGCINVSWQPVSYADGYEIYTSSEQSGDYTYAGETSECEYVLTDLPKGKTYVRVRAYIGDGTDRIYGALSYARSDYSGLDPIMGLTATLTNTNSVKLTWEASNGAEGYSIYMSENIDGEYKCLANKTNLSYTKSELAPGTYYFKLRAYYMDGTSKVFNSFTDIIEVTIPDTAE